MKTYLMIIGLLIPVFGFTQVNKTNEYDGMVKIGSIYVDKYEAPNTVGEVPFVMFTFTEAECWCQARGKRLLFDDEWELAAGGPLSLPYVYGVTYDSLLCNDNKNWISYDPALLNMWPSVPNLNNINTFSELIDSVINISSNASLSANHVLYLYQADTSGKDTSCVSYYRVIDMNGNVSEWTRRRDGGSPGFHGNLKGGYWAGSMTIQTNTTVHGDGFRFYQTGFRCAKDSVCINTTNSITDTACSSYTAPDGTVYTTSGIKTAIIPNAAGCDSTITIDLTIDTVNVSVTVNDPTITANATGASYQWVDCDNGFTNIGGQVNQSFMATANGNYAVIVTQGLCSDTSACTQITTVGFASSQIEGITIYPNPVTNELIIEIKENKEKTDFEILNSTGQIIFKGYLSEKTVVQTTDFAPGIYLIKFMDGKTFEFKKIIKD
jgi:hypothetical protein